VVFIFSSFAGSTFTVGLANESL